MPSTGWFCRGRGVGALSNNWRGAFAEGLVCWLRSRHLRSDKKTQPPGLAISLPRLLFRAWNQPQLRGEHVEPTCVYKLVGPGRASSYLSMCLSVHCLPARSMSGCSPSLVLLSAQIFLLVCVFTGRNLKRKRIQPNQPPLNTILLQLMYVLWLFVSLHFYHS